MAKKQILVKLVVDSREKDLSFLNKFKFDKKFSTEKIKIEGYEIHTPFKSLDKEGNEITTSTGDIGIIWSVDDGESWNKSNLSIELKKDSDFTTTLYSNWKRFSAEIDRVEEYGLDFYLLYSQSTSQMHDHFNKLKSMQKIPYKAVPHKVVYDRMLELGDRNITMIYTHEIEEVIKRIVKHHIKKNKLQYK